MHVCVYRHTHEQLPILCFKKKKLQKYATAWVLWKQVLRPFGVQDVHGGTAHVREKKEAYLAVEERELQCRLPSSLAGELLSVTGHVVLHQNAWTKVARP